MRRSILFAVLLLTTTSVVADECRFGFATGDKFLSGLIPSAVFGDFNEDGRIDVVTHQVVNVVYLNRGDGKFDGKPLALNGYNLLAALDMNHDGHLDLVFDDMVGVALGDGKGNFGPLIDSGNGTAPNSERLIDLNGDGLKDIVYQTNISPRALMVQFALGDGRFGPPSQIGAPIRADSTYRIGDFDGDGAPDLFWVSQVWWNDGKGNFVPSKLKTADFSDVTILDPFDFDHDGADDLLFATATNGLKLLRLRGRNVTITPVTSDDPQPGWGNLTSVADLDGDGYLDAVFSNEMVVWGSPDPTRLQTTHFDLGTSPPGVFRKGAAVVDFDGDGRLDLVGTGGAEGLTILHTKPGSRELFAGDVFGTPFSYVRRSNAVGDVNGDKWPDRIVMDVQVGTGSVYFGDGKGDFIFHNSFNADRIPSDGSSIAIADFDGDGNGDLLIHTKQLRILFGDGHGSFVSSLDVAASDSDEFSSSVLPAPHGARSLIMITNHMNDGSVSTVSVARDRTATVTPVAGLTSSVPWGLKSINGVPVMFVRLDAEHYEVREYVGDRWGTIGTLNMIAGVALDLDGDGVSELVYESPHEDVFMTRVTPSGLSPPRAITNFPSYAFSASVVADVDGDGKSDLVFIRQSSEYSWQVQVAHNTGDGFELTAAATITSPSIMAADVNGDGRDDLLVMDSNRVEVLTSTCIPVPPVVSHVIPALPLAGDDVTVTIERSYSYGSLTDGSGTSTTGILQQDGSVAYHVGRLSAGTHTFSYDETGPQFGTRHATITVTVFNSVPRRHLVRH